jgi:hypothetical protein
MEARWTSSGRDIPKCASVASLKSLTAAALSAMIGRRWPLHLVPTTRARRRVSCKPEPHIRGVSGRALGRPSANPLPAVVPTPKDQPDCRAREPSAPAYLACLCRTHRWALGPLCCRLQTFRGESGVPVPPDGVNAIDQCRKNCKFCNNMLAIGFIRF